MVCYVGYDEEGQLTEAVRRRPDSVLLFDEIDKSRPDAFRVALQLLDDGRRLQKRLAERKLTITLTETAKDALALAGYDPVYGARPLKRAIQRQVADPLAQRLLAGTFREGDYIVIDANEEGVLSFTKQESKSAEREPVAT